MDRCFILILVIYLSLMNPFFFSCSIFKLAFMYFSLRFNYYNLYFWFQISNEGTYMAIHPWCLVFLSMSNKSCIFPALLSHAGSTKICFWTCFEPWLNCFLCQWNIYIKHFREENYCFIMLGFLSLKLFMMSFHFKFILHENLCFILIIYAPILGYCS